MKEKLLKIYKYIFNNSHYIAYNQFFGAITFALRAFLIMSVLITSFILTILPYYNYELQECLNSLPLKRVILVIMFDYLLIKILASMFQSKDNKRGVYFILSAAICIVSYAQNVNKIVNYYLINFDIQYITPDSLITLFIKIALMWILPIIMILLIRSLFQFLRYASEPHTFTLQNIYFNCKNKYEKEAANENNRPSCEQSKKDIRIICVMVLLLDALVAVFFRSLIAGITLFPEHNTDLEKLLNSIFGILNIWLFSAIGCLLFLMNIFVIFLCTNSKKFYMSSNS